MIDLTPLDVRKKKGDFPKALRGYEPGRVDEFLDLAAERLEELVRENATLRERVALLTGSVEDFRHREQAMNEALISAQQLREEVRSQAAREAELAIREARAEGERLVEEARRKVTEITESARRLHVARARFLRGFRTFVERQLDELALEEERTRDGGAPPSPAAPAAPAAPPAEATRPATPPTGG